MKKIIFSTIVLLAFSTLSHANKDVEKKEFPVNVKKNPIKSCIVHIIIVDEKNVAIGSINVDIANPKSYTDCLLKGIEENKKLNDAGVLTDKVYVQSYS